MVCGNVISNNYSAKDEGLDCRVPATAALRYHGNVDFHPDSAAAATHPSASVPAAHHGKFQPRGFFHIRNTLSFLSSSEKFDKTQSQRLMLCY